MASNLFPQALGLRVIVAGLGRTGTMSMLTALQRLGDRSLFSGKMFKVGSICSSSSEIRCILL